MQRRLDWEGCAHVRDLGGLPAADGRTTRFGALVRAGDVDRLTDAGWAALVEHGVRTVVDLRNADERTRMRPRPAEVKTVWVPLDGQEHADFWAEWASGPQFGTPLYYGPFLERLPERSVAALRAVARARPGGVLFHCVSGRDRSGLVAMLLLALAGVPAPEIARDYELTVHEDADIHAFLAERGTTAGRLIVETLAGLDVETLLRTAGLADEDVRALRERLLG